MSSIKIDKSFNVSNVVVTPEAVRALVKIIDEAKKGLPKPKEYSYVRFSYEVTASDGSRYSSETPELFKLLDTKQIERVAIQLWDSGNDAGIDVDLFQGNFASSSVLNRIRVMGTDSTWVSGTSDKLRVAVSEFRKQDAWPRAYQEWLLIISALIFGRIAFRIGSYVFTHIIRIVVTIPFLEIVPGNEWLLMLLRWLWIFLLGIPFALPLVTYLTELWPSVEFRMGYDWQQLLGERKKRLVWFCTAVILPLLVSVAYDVLKHYALL
jgi:hypothetical protein